MNITSYSDIYKTDPTLRPYQQKAKKEIFESWDEVDNVMFQMPTGTGKTRLFTSIISDINKYSIQRREAVKILIVAHRTELIDQIDKHLDKYKVPHNIIAGGREKNYKFPVTIASIQTITNTYNIKEAKKLNVQFIIIDEAHHALAASYKKLWDMYPNAKRLGVTATPWRMNHQSFLELFNKLVMSMPIKEFIKKGYLSSYKYYSLRDDSYIQNTINEIELDSFGEYKESSMEEKMDIGSIRAQLLDSYLSLAEGKKGIIYAINITHAKHICIEYEEAGYKVVCIDSKTPSAEREQLVKDFRNGIIDIIVNVDIFSEGFDCPDIEFIQLARPTRSLVKYLQQVGRGLRPTENKQNCVILDNVGLYSRFGLPDARRHWNYHFKGKKIDEEPSKVISRGMGKSRYVDLSEGTEDMELIQDNYEDVEPMDGFLSDVGDFFPSIFGVTLGNTTLEQAIKLGGKEKVDEDTGDIYCNIENVQFYSDSNNIITWIYWKKNDRDFPSLWNSKGFYWENSYDAWLDVFKRLGYKIEIENEPEHKMHGGRITLSGSFEALSPDDTLSFYMKFDYGEKGYFTSSPSTLYSISVHYHESPIESIDDDPEDEEYVEVEEVNPLKGEDVEKLKHAFNKKTTSYKYFWFMALLEIYKETLVEKITFRQILIKMVTKAWKYVFMLNGQFSQLDQLPKYLTSLKSLTGLQNNSMESEVEDELNKIFDTQKIKAMLSPLLKNVPYRFLSPWIPFTDNDDVMEKSCNKELRCPYELYNDYVVISVLWREVLIDYYNSIQLLIEYGLEAYLKIDQNTKEAYDFYNTRFISLNQLLRGTKRRKKQEVVKQFLEKYDFSSKGEITPAELMLKMPDSSCVIEREGRKRVNVPGEMWSLKIMDILLSGEKLGDQYENVQLLGEYGINLYLKTKEIRNTQDLYNTKYISLNKLLKAIRDNKEEKVVRQFLDKYKFSSTGAITPAELMKIMPEENCVIDREGRKRVNVPGGMWSLKLLDQLLSG